MNMDEIFLVEKGWVDPLENRDATGYKIYCFFVTEESAKDFCNVGGFFTSDDCWQVEYKYSGKMPKFRYTKVTHGAHTDAATESHE